MCLMSLSYRTPVGASVPVSYPSARTRSTHQGHGLRQGSTGVAGRRLAAWISKATPANIKTAAAQV